MSIANAGYGVVGRVDALSIEDYRRQFDTNVLGVIRTIQASLPSITHTRGSVVIMGSVAGYVSMAGASPYAMSKFSLRALAQSLRFELTAAGVAVTLVSPGFVESEIRHVDNAGVLQPGTADPIPAWLRMPADRAASIIVRAVQQRRREVVVTAHGKLIVAVDRVAPWAIRAAIRLAGLRGRSAPETRS